MQVYNYQKIYSNYLQNCNNGILDLKGEKTASRSLANGFSNVDETNLIYNSANLYKCDLINLKNIQDLSRIFYGCSYLNNLDSLNWNLQNVKEFSYGFASCSNLTSLNCSTGNLTNVKNVDHLFTNCYNLAILNMADLNMYNTNNAFQMFENCYNLQNLNINNGNTGYIYNVARMFYNCYTLNNLDFSNWQTRSGFVFNNMAQMFYGCYGLQELNFTKIDTSYTDNLYQTFSGCTNLKTIIKDNGSMGLVTNMARFFELCTSLENINVSNGKLTNCLNAALMFHACYNLVNLDVSNGNTRKIQNMHGMFAEYTSIGDVGPTNAKTLDVSNGDVYSAKDMSGMFGEQDNLHNIDISNGAPSSVVNLSQMFVNSYGTLENGIFNGEKGNVYYANDFTEMFRGAGVIDAKISTGRAPNAQSISGMFRYCNDLTNNSLRNIAKFCLNCPNIAYKNLMINNIYSPVYNASRKININTIPAIYCYQLLQNNGNGEFEIEESVSQDSAIFSIDEISDPKDTSTGYECEEVVKIQIYIINNGNQTQTNGSLSCNINQELILENMTLAPNTVSSAKLFKIPITETMIRQGQSYPVTFTYNYTVNNTNKEITFTKTINLAQLNPNLFIEFRTASTTENTVEGNIFIRNTGTATLRNINIASIIPNVEENDFTITSLAPQKFTSFDVVYTKTAGSADIIEGDINYSAEYENQQGVTQTISNSLTYNVKTTPIQYKIYANTQSGYINNMGGSTFYVTGFDNLLDQIRNFGDFYQIDIEELEEEV